MSSAPEDSDNIGQPNDKSSAQKNSGSSQSFDRANDQSSGSEKNLSGNQPSTLMSAPVIEHRVDKELGFVDLLLIAKRHILLMIVIFTAVAVMAGYRFSKAERLYRSSTVIHISRKDSNIGKVENFRNAAKEEDFLNTMIALLQSDDVLLSTYREIAGDPEMRRKVVFEEFSRGPDAWSQYVVSNLRIRLGGEGETKKANVLSVSYTSTSAQEAYVVISVLLDQFQIYFEKQYSKTTSAVQKSLQEGIQEVSKGIAATNARLDQYLLTADVALIGVRENNPVLTRIQGLEENLVDLDYQGIRLQNRLDMIQSRIGGRKLEDIPEDELIVILGSGNENISGIGQEQSIATITALARGGDMGDTLNTTLLKLDIEQSALMLKEIARLKEQNIGEDNPQMLALRKGYEDLIEYRRLRTGLGEGETLNKIGIFTYREYAETYLDVLKHRIAAIDKQRQLLEDFIDSQASAIQSINDHFLELETIRFSIASQKELHMQLVRKLDQVNILSKYGGYKIEVVLQPSEPTLPFAPNKSKYALLTILLGGITGFAFAFLRDMTDRTFRTPDAISAALGIHLLAQMPSFKMTQKYRKELDLSASSEPGTPVGSLFAYHFPDSVQCETFRALRSKVFLNSRVKPKTVLFTSPHSGDGKTTFISSMAIMLAEADKKVLLIDGDIRKPDIHRKFNLKNEEGFAELLAGTHTEEELARPTKLKNLFVITAGLQRKNPSERFIAANFDQILEKPKEKYDFILIDTSPVLYVSDVCNIAARTDGVIYIFRIRHNGQPDVTQGVRMMADVGANFIGCVVNCYMKHRFYDPTAVSRKKATYGYGYGYGGYGYGGYGYGGYGYSIQGAGGYGYGPHYGSAYTGYGYGAYGRQYGSYGEGRDDEGDDGNPREKEKPDSR
jgi:capsular exopolysaccharide synthesis family protein